MVTSDPKYITYTDKSFSKDNPLFELATDVTLRWVFRGKTESIFVPCGFQTDFGSIPKFARCAISNVSVYDTAYLLHDRLYDKECMFDITRSDADILLRRNLMYLDMGFMDYWAVYYSVKYFGESHWRK